MATQENEFERAVETARARWEALPSDRAKASVFTSVTPAPVGNPNPWHASGALSNDVNLPTSIVVQPPQISNISGRIQQFSPVKIGYLIDIDAGTGLSDSLDAVVLACEDALNDGELKRPIAIIPSGRARSATGRRRGHRGGLSITLRRRVSRHPGPLHHGQRDGTPRCR